MRLLINTGLQTGVCAAADVPAVLTASLSERQGNQKPLKRLLREDPLVSPGLSQVLRRSLYLVKINLIPAMISTVARQSEIPRTAKRLLPRWEPMMPPIIAAAARMNPSEGMVRTFVK